METTEQLALRARRGDVDAFTKLVERYQGMAFAYALATLGDFNSPRMPHSKRS